MGPVQFTASTTTAATSASAASHALGQRTAREDVQCAQGRRCGHNGQQGQDLYLLPRRSVGRQHGQRGRSRQHQRLHHQDEGHSAALAPLHQQVQQERRRDGRHGAAAHRQQKRRAVQQQAGKVQAALLPVLRTGGQTQRQQDGRAGGAGEHVGVFKNGLETLLLQQGVQLHGRAELGGEGHHQLVEKLGGHGVDADQGHQRSRRFQHRGGAASRAARPLRLQRRQQQGQTRRPRHLQKFVQGELAGGGVQRGDAVHADIESQQQRGPAHAAAQLRRFHHDAHHRRSQQQQGDALVGSMLHQTGDEKVKNSQHRHQPRTPQLLMQ